MLDLTLREWLLILGSIFILGVLLHGYLRPRKNNNPLILDRSLIKDADPVTPRADLPNAAPGPQAVQETVAEASHDDAAQQAEFPDAGIQEKIIQVHVLALDEPFTGQRLLEVLTHSGLVFGEMDIFHKLDEQRRVEFSLASAVEPGVFDLPSIETFSSPGVTLFLRVHELPEPLRVFDDLLEVAQNIALELQGEVRDETRSVMTPQTIDHYRQVIKDFQFKHSA